MFEEFSSQKDLLEKSLKNLSEADCKKLIYLLPGKWTNIPA